MLELVRLLETQPTLGLGERPTSPDRPGLIQAGFWLEGGRVGSRGSGPGSGPGRGTNRVCHNRVTCPCVEMCVTAGRGGAVCSGLQASSHCQTLTCRKSRGAGLSRLGPANRSRPPARLKVGGFCLAAKGTGLLLWTYLEVTGEGWWVKRSDRKLQRRQLCYLRTSASRDRALGTVGVCSLSFRRGDFTCCFGQSWEGRGLRGQTGAHRAATSHLGLREEGVGPGVHAGRWPLQQLLWKGPALAVGERGHRLGEDKSPE